MTPRTVGWVCLRFAGMALGFCVSNAIEARTDPAAVGAGVAVGLSAGNLVLRRWTR